MQRNQSRHAREGKVRWTLIGGNTAALVLNAIAFIAYCSNSSSASHAQSFAMVMALVVAAALVVWLSHDLRSIRRVNASVYAKAASAVPVRRTS